MTSGWKEVLQALSLETDEGTRREAGARFPALLDALRARLRRSTGADDAAIDDALQTVAEKVWQRTARFDGVTDGEAYCFLYRVAYNTLVSIQRWKGGRPGIGQALYDVVDETRRAKPHEVKDFLTRMEEVVIRANKRTNIPVRELWAYIDVQLGLASPRPDEKGTSAYGVRRFRLRTALLEAQAALLQEREPDDLDELIHKILVTRPGEK